MINPFKKKKLNISYPLDEIETWEEIKKTYFSFGYEWADLNVHYSKRQLKNMDKKNRKKYNDLKRNEKKLRNSLKGVAIPFIMSPPSPNNYNRLRILKKWNKEHPYYNICMASVYLLEKFDLRPCRDYSPDEVLDIYMDKSIVITPGYINPTAPPRLLRINLPSYEETQNRVSR